MIQRLLVVAAGIVGKLQFYRQIAVVAHIAQRLNDRSVIHQAATGGNVAAGNHIVIFAMDVKDIFAAQHVDGPLRIDVLGYQVAGIQLDAEVGAAHILQRLQHGVGLDVKNQ